MSWKPGEEAEVAAAILDLFHLLPRAAVKFLEAGGEGRSGLVVLALQLEATLGALPAAMPHPRVLWSPYRCARSGLGLSHHLLSWAGLAWSSVNKFGKPSCLAGTGISQLILSTYSLIPRCRDPLLRFLSNYPAEAVAYFLEPARLADSSHLSRFIDLLRAPAGSALLKQLAESEDKLADALAGPMVRPPRYQRPLFPSSSFP